MAVQVAAAVAARGAAATAGRAAAGAGAQAARGAAAQGTRAAGSGAKAASASMEKRLLQQSRAAARQAPQPATTPEHVTRRFPDILDQRLEETKNDPRATFRQSIQQARVIAQQAKSQASSQVNKQVKKAAKQAVVRGSNFAINTVCTVLNIGTAGTAIVVTFVVQLFSLGYLNLEVAKVHLKILQFIPDFLLSKGEWAPIPLLDQLDRSKTILTFVTLLLDMIVFLVFIVSIIIVTIPLWLPAVAGVGALNFLGLL